MKLRKEPLIWFIFFAAASAGVFVLAGQLQPSASSHSQARQYLLHATPAVSAALALPALFLLLRFLVNGQLSSPSPSRPRHIIAAILVSIAGICTWEVSQMYLQGSTFTFPVFVGALLGSLIFWLFWLLARNWLDASHRNTPPSA